MELPGPGAEGAAFDAAFWRAVREDDAVALQGAVTADTVDLGNERGLVPLHYAARYNRLRVATLLLSLGANPNALARKVKFTPLHLACFHGASEAMMALLMRHGADKDVQSSYGFKPLDCCKDDEVRARFRRAKKSVNPSKYCADDACIAKIRGLLKPLRMCSSCQKKFCPKHCSGRTCNACAEEKQNDASAGPIQSVMALQSQANVALRRANKLHADAKRHRKVVAEATEKKKAAAAAEAFIEAERFKGEAMTANVALEETIDALNEHKARIDNLMEQLKARLWRDERDKVHAHADSQRAQATSAKKDAVEKEDFQGAANHKNEETKWAAVCDALTAAIAQLATIERDTAAVLAQATDTLVRAGASIDDDYRNGEPGSTNPRAPLAPGGEEGELEFDDALMGEDEEGQQRPPEDGGEDAER